MTEIIELDGEVTLLETIEEVTELLEVVEQGPAGPPGPPSGGLNAGKGIKIETANTVAIDESVVATQDDLITAKNTAVSESQNYTDVEINDLALSTSQLVSQASVDMLESANTYADTKSNAALTAAQAYTDAAVTQIIRDCGDYTLVGILFPTTGGSGSSGNIRKGDMFWIKGATDGVSNLQGIPVNNGDQIRALTSNPSQNPFLWGIIEGNLGLTPENKANKVTDLSSPNNTTYLTTMGIYNQLLLKANTSSLAAVATSGSYTDLSNKPTIPAAQVASDWNASSGVSQVLNKPTTRSGYGITDAAALRLTQTTETATFTLALTDANTEKKLNFASAGTITVPPNSVIPFIPRDTIFFANIGTGLPTFAQGAGVTVKKKQLTFKMLASPSWCYLEYDGADVWWLVGDLSDT